MQDTEAITREKKALDPKKPRYVRRLEKWEQEFLNKLVLSFFTERSAIENPDGEIAGYLFDDYNAQWKRHCINFNRQKHPIKLKYEAFTETVEHYIKLEEKQIRKALEDNKTKDFDYWLRHVKMGEALFFVVLWYKILSFGNREKQLHSLKNYYIKHILPKIN
jgi:hypothetical protein